MYSKRFCAIPTASLQVTLKRISCISEWVEMSISVNIRGRAVVMLIKTMRGKGEGGCGGLSVVGLINISEGL